MILPRYLADAPHPTLHDGARTGSEFAMTSPLTVVFDLDGTLVDTAPDLIGALNFVLDREGLPPVPLHAARNMIGAGARKRAAPPACGTSPALRRISSITTRPISPTHHVRSRGSKPRSMISRRAATASRSAPTSSSGCQSCCSTGWN